MKIHKGSHSYLDQIVACQLAMAKETENLDLDINLLTKGVRAVLDDPRKGQYYLMVEDKKVLAMLLTIPEWSDWRNKTVLWIHSVYVIPEYRKQGLFQKLYNHLKNMVNESNEFAGLRLYVDKSNTKAQAVYQKLGMSDEHYQLFEWLKTY